MLHDTRRAISAALATVSRCAAALAGAVAPPSDRTTSGEATPPAADDEGFAVVYPVTPAAESMRAKRRPGDPGGRERARVLEGSVEDRARAGGEW